MFSVIYTLWSLFEYILFMVRGTLVAVVDLYIMYMRVGLVWRGRRRRAASMEKGDLVVQVAPQSPHHSKLCELDVILHLNETFIDRRLWKGLSAANTLPSAVVTGVSYGGIGFYTALHLLLCGVNVHGITRTAQRAQKAERALQVAVERQCRLHKEWVGKVGRMTFHHCNLSDGVQVCRLADAMAQDPNLRIVVCNAGPMATPLALSPQHLEEQFATHHVGHSLLVMRLLQHRLRAQEFVSGTQQPVWRFVVVSSAAAAAASGLPAPSTTFREWGSIDELRKRCSRYRCYGDAKMCELLFALALDRFLKQSRSLAPYCTVNVLHPGPIRSRVIPNSQLPLPWLLDGEAAATFRMSPVIAGLYIADLALSRRHERTSGHYFRMGEDQTVSFAALRKSESLRNGFWVNTTMSRGIPGPAIALSPEKQEWLWGATLNYFKERGYLDGRYFN